MRPAGEIWPAALSGDCPAGAYPAGEGPGIDGPAQAETLILTPHRTNTDGFFVAIMERR